MLLNKLQNPLPTFLGNVSISRIHPDQLLPELQLREVLQTARAGENRNCGTLQQILILKCMMHASILLGRLYSKSHTHKLKCGFCKVISYLFKENTMYHCCSVKMQPDSALGCIAFPPIDFQMNKLSLGI